jgi:hypothetical protein
VTEPAARAALSPAGRGGCHSVTGTGIGRGLAQALTRAVAMIWTRDCHGQPGERHRRRCTGAAVQAPAPLSRLAAPGAGRAGRPNTVAELSAQTVDRVMVVPARVPVPTHWQTDAGTRAVPARVPASV